MTIPEMFTWVQANWTTIIQWWLQIIGAASIVVKMTPTLKDDNILKGIIKFTGKFVALDKYGPDGVAKPDA